MKVYQESRERYIQGRKIKIMIHSHLGINTSGKKNKIQIYNSVVQSIVTNNCEVQQLTVSLLKNARGNDLHVMENPDEKGYQTK